MKILKYIDNKLRNVNCGVITMPCVLTDTKL